MVELDQHQLTLVYVVLATACLSSFLTILLLLLAFKFKIGPAIDRKVEGQLKNSMNIMEERIRTRMIEVLAGKSEVLVDRARGLAKTGMSLFANRPPPREGGGDQNEE